MSEATASSALPPEQLSERVAAAGLLLPVALMLLLSALSHKDGSAGPIALSDTVLAQGVGIELVLAVTIGFWLWRRGWRPLKTATYPFQPLDLARGMVLWAGAIAAVALWCWSAERCFPISSPWQRRLRFLAVPGFGCQSPTPSSMRCSRSCSGWDSALPHSADSEWEWQGQSAPRPRCWVMGIRGPLRWGGGVP